MRRQKVEKLIHVGRYVVKVEVELLEDDHVWSPYYSNEDALKMDRVRKAMHDGDLKAAARDGEVFEMMPVAAE